MPKYSMILTPHADLYYALSIQWWFRASWAVMGDRAMSLSWACGAVLLTTVLISQRLITSARQFTARCTKKPDDHFLCANNAPDVELDPPDGTTGYMGCAMRCTGDEQCLHFNHRSSSSTTCQLFHSPPSNYSVIAGCENYRATPTGAHSAF